MWWDTYFLPLLVIVLTISLAAYYGVKQYLAAKRGELLRYDWITVINFATQAVAAVEQIYKTRPDNVTKDGWDKMRLETAVQMIESFAANIGIVIRDKKAIYAAIESVIFNANKSKRDGEGITIGTLSPVFNQ